MSRLLRGSTTLWITLFSILRQQAYTGIIAFGLTLVMITGNIDLSVGSMLTFLCCVCAKIMMGTDNGLLGIFGTIAAGAICGLINGVLVSYVKLNSFITTLGTSSIFTALALRISSGTVLVIPDNCDPLFQAVGVTSFGPVHILIDVYKRQGAYPRCRWDLRRSTPG